jgi:HSP20 family protein
MMFDPRGRWPGDLDQLQREMERYLQHVSQKKPHTVVFSQRTWQPAVDVYESDRDDAVVAVVDLAGVKQEEIELIVGRNSLTIRGERRDPADAPDRRFSCMEIPFGPFERAVPLPAAVDPDSVSATYEAGFLRVVMPKASRREPRRVAVSHG